MDLIAKLEKAKSEVFAIELEIGRALCVDVGHDWVSYGGANAYCCQECDCSIPVYRCSKCGDFDYGDNEEAEQIRMDCDSRHPTPSNREE